MYRNHEGYADPTAGEAFAHIVKEERRTRRNAGMRLAYADGHVIPPSQADAHRPKKNRPPRSEQRARQKANKAKGRSGIA